MSRNDAQDRDRKRVAGRHMQIVVNDPTEREVLRRYAHVTKRPLSTAVHEAALTHAIQYLQKYDREIAAALKSAPETDSP